MRSIKKLSATVVLTLVFAVAAFAGEGPIGKTGEGPIGYSSISATGEGPIGRASARSTGEGPIGYLLSLLASFRF